MKIRPVSFFQPTAASSSGGGSDPTNPPSLASMRAWYRCDSVVTSGSDITQFTDKSGNGLHLNIGPESTGHATLANSVDFNNKPVATFTGAQYYEIFDLSLSYTPTSLVFFHKFNSGAFSSDASRTFFNFFDNSFNLNAMQYRYISGWICNYATFGFGSWSPNNPHLEYNPTHDPDLLSSRMIMYTYASDGTGNFYLNNEIDPASVSFTPPTTIVGMILGASYGGDSNKYIGEAAEVIIYDKILNSTELADLWSYAQSYYGL